MDDTAPSLFTGIYAHVLGELDNFQALHTASGATRQALQRQLLQNTESRVHTQLSQITETNTHSWVEIDGMHRWLTVMHDEFNSENSMEDPTTLARRYIFTFARLIRGLDAMRRDLPACLRKLMDTIETPEVQRLQKVRTRVSNSLKSRLDIERNLNRDLSDISQKLAQRVRTNTQLSEECELFVSKLEAFTNSESYKLLQKARQNAMITQEWEIKKANLTRELQLVEFELHHYTDKARAIPELTKLLVQQENEHARAMADFADEKRRLREDESVAHSAQDSAMRALVKDLEGARSQAVAKERRNTAQLTTNAKAGGDRLIQKLTAENHATITALTRASRKKKSDGEGLDSARAIDLIAEDHANAQNKLQFLFETQIQELQEHLRAFSEAGVSNVEDQIRLVDLNHQKVVSLLAIEGDRYRQQTSVRNIEVHAVNARLLVLDGVVSDYLGHSDELREIRRKLVKKCLKRHPEVLNEQERADLDCHRLFVRKAKSIVAHCAMLYQSYLDGDAPIALISNIGIRPRSRDCIHPPLNFQFPVGKKEQEVGTLPALDRESKKENEPVPIPPIGIQLPVEANTVAQSEATAETERAADSPRNMADTGLAEPEALVKKTAVPTHEQIAERLAVSKREAIGEQPALTKRQPTADKPTVTKREPIGEQPAVTRREPTGENPAVQKRESIGEQPTVTEREPTEENPAVPKRESLVEHPVLMESERIPGEPSLREGERTMTESIVAAQESMMKPPTISEPEPIDRTVLKRKGVPEDKPVRQRPPRAGQRRIPSRASLLRVDQDHKKARPPTPELIVEEESPHQVIEWEAVRRKPRRSVERQITPSEPISRGDGPLKSATPIQTPAQSLRGEISKGVRSLPQGRRVLFSVLPLSGGGSNSKLYSTDDFDSFSPTPVGNARPVPDSQTWIHR
jgi:hypothetical protein